MSVKKSRQEQTSFTILERDDGLKAVILRYKSKKDYIGTNSDMPEQDEDDDDFAPNICIRSEFLGARRLMIILSGEEETDNS